MSVYGVKEYQSIHYVSYQEGSDSLSYALPPPGPDFPIPKSGNAAVFSIVGRIVQGHSSGPHTSMFSSLTP